MSPEAKALAAEEHEAGKKQLFVSLSCAIDIWDLIQAKATAELDASPGFAILTLGKEEILAAVRPHFPTPLSDHRVSLMGRALAKQLGEGPLSTCGMWEFAHTLDHILWEPIENLAT
jgi:hypothetical protein